MVRFRPFRGWRYNPQMVGNVADVLCPPYDMVTPDLQQRLRDRNQYNVVHLEAGESLDWNAPVKNQYAGTAQMFQNWTQTDVLRRDAEPSFYLLRHNFTMGDRQLARMGIMGCVGLEPYQARRVLPHEFTEEPAVMDRVSIMEACGANFSPIMSLYRDADGELNPTIQNSMTATPEIQVQDESGHGMTLWRICDPGATETISRFFSDRPVFLADGHHRYEAALRLQQRRSGPEDAGPNAAHNFILMTLIAFDDPGLLVLPYHRVLGTVPEDTLKKILERLDGIFQAEPASSKGQSDPEDLVQQVSERGRHGHALAVVGPNGQEARIMTLRDGIRWKDWGPLGGSEAWILEEQVLKPVLGDTTLQHLGFIHEHDDAVAQVNSGAQQMAFLFKPFPLDEFEAIVGDGNRLPRKSTFFYPKLPTGLVINQLNGVL